MLIVAVITAVSCQKDEIDTAQYSDSAVTLASFGPNPAMRGGTVTFYGSNLDKVTEINVPGMSLITGSAIEVVESGKTSQIRITLDIETPEVGYITLKASDGTVLQTKSEVTYKEPIVFDGFIAKDVNYPGDVITLQGTYLDLVKAVIFEGGEEVPVEEGATRHSAAVVIPANALSGVIILSDKAEIESLFYSKEALVIGEPAVTASEKVTAKVGETLSFTGEHLEMIEMITMEGAEVTEFTLADDHKSISFTLPATAKSGDFHAVSFAGKSYKAGEVDAIVPVAASVSPSPVKAGETLVIKGENLDLITKVAFDGDDNATFSYADEALQISVANTVKEGKVQLITANGSAVEAEFTLVHPCVTKVEPETIFAGDTISITGTDLDLIVKANLGKNEETVIPVSESEILVATSATAVSGRLVLTLANGETVTASENILVDYHSLVVVDEFTESQHIGEEVVFKGSNMDLIENIFIGGVKVTQYSIRTPEEVRFRMPWLKVGSYDVVFHLFSGDDEQQPNRIGVLLEREIKTIFEGSQKVAWNDDAPYLDNFGDKALQKLAWGGYNWNTVVPGTTIMVSLRTIPDDGYSQIRFGNGNWNALPGTPDSMDLASDATYASVTLTQEMLDVLCENGLVICGNGFEITKVELIREISQESTLWEGEAVADNWENQPYLLSDGGKEFTENGVEAGMEIRFYLTPLEKDWKLQIVEGHWGDTYVSKCSVGNDTENGKFSEIDLAANGGYISFTLTESMIAASKVAGGWGGIFVANGDNVKITKITVM